MEEEDFLKKNTDAIVPGEDVSKLSISELEVRITVLLQEIERIKGVIKRKNESKDTANSVFKL